jgi:hypothetical protein
VQFRSAIRERQPGAGRLAQPKRRCDLRWMPRREVTVHRICGTIQTGGGPAASRKAPLPPRGLPHPPPYLPQLTSPAPKMQDRGGLAFAALRRYRGAPTPRGRRPSTCKDVSRAGTLRAATAGVLNVSPARGWQTFNLGAGHSRGSALPTVCTCVICRPSRSGALAPAYERKRPDSTLSLLLPVGPDRPKRPRADPAGPDMRLP